MIRVDLASITTIALAGAAGYALLAGGVILWKKVKGG
jgi:hypothetical protein